MSASQEEAARALRPSVGDDAAQMIRRLAGQLTTLGMLLEHQRQVALVQQVELGQLQRDYSRMRQHLDGVEASQRRFKNQTFRQRVRWMLGR